MDAICFHHVSSVAVAGLYPGTFSETMFAETENLNDPYFRTKHDSEALVRAVEDLPWRVYRPSMVVGHSETGEMDKTDGPYYLFPFIRMMEEYLPNWLPLLGIKGGKLNLVPVDFVVAAMDHIAHKEGLDGQCFHLTDTLHHTVGKILNIFSSAAGAPKRIVHMDTGPMWKMAAPFRKLFAAMPGSSSTMDFLLQQIGLPPALLNMIDYDTEFDCTNTLRALEGSGIEVPHLRSYSQPLWDYWYWHLNTSVKVEQRLKIAVKGKTILITGASSGIGRAAAIRLGAAGARIILAARGQEKLHETEREIEMLGGVAHSYTCDMNDMEDVDRLVSQVLKDHVHVDILVNNAGRSIRRSLKLSFDRFHDFQRTMNLNYFGALRLIIGLIPPMIKRRRGHIINISSIAAVAGTTPRFTAYTASKAALDAFSKGAATKLLDRDIKFTTIYMPLVRTPMIAPTKIYNRMPLLTPDQAAGMIADAVIHKPRRIVTPAGHMMQILTAIMPSVPEFLQNRVYKIFGDSEAAKGKKPPKVAPELTTEQKAIATILKGMEI